MIISKEDIKQIKKTPEFLAFVSRMYYANCDERESYMQKPYSSEEQYLESAQKFLIESFIEQKT